MWRLGDERFVKFRSFFVVIVSAMRHLLKYIRYYYCIRARGSFSLRSNVSLLPSMFSTDPLSLLSFILLITRKDECA